MMEKAAAKSDERELYVRLGNVYLDGDQFAKAADSVSKGLKKGGVKRPDQARLVLGMAYFNLGEYNKARKAFRDAGKDERSEKYAKQWISYVTSEEERQREDGLRRVRRPRGRAQAREAGERIRPLMGREGVRAESAEERGRCGGARRDRGERRRGWEIGNARGNERREVRRASSRADGSLRKIESLLIIGRRRGVLRASPARSRDGTFPSPPSLSPLRSLLTRPSSSSRSSPSASRR